MIHIDRSKCAERQGERMKYIWTYKTPGRFDDLVMCGDGEALTGLWFEGSRDDCLYARGCERRETPVFRDTCRWLDEYFAGRDPGFMPRCRVEGATPFRRAVIDEMLKIPSDRAADGLRRHPAAALSLNRLRDVAV